MKGIIHTTFLIILKLLYILLIPLLILLCVIIPKSREQLIWGPDPLISNKYWSEAMQEAGFRSCTVMTSYYPINKKEDFDIYYDDLVPGWVFIKPVREALKPFFAFLFYIRTAKVVHLPFSGGPLGNTSIARLESLLFNWAGIKTILIPYGGDAYMCSQIIDPSLRNGLLLSYPNLARIEDEISSNVKYWVKHADIVFAGFMIDGIGRWDVTLPSVIIIDTRKWEKKVRYSMNNGVNGPVKVIHTPNHRGFKGTEYIIKAVNELKGEGLQVELIMLEKMPNDTIRKLMPDADILVEQLILGYALSAMEGMASGLPVLSNLGVEEYTRVYRRYAYLNECPILSTSPETIKENLRILVTNPVLRKELGEAGRLYVEKYHSYKTAQYIFGSIYSVILDGQERDLMNLFHPLKSEYVKSAPNIVHRLKENRLPEMK